MDIVSFLLPLLEGQLYKIRIKIQVFGQKMDIASSSKGIGILYRSLNVMDFKKKIL